MDKPSPVASPIEMPFWEAAKKGELIVQKCLDCNRFVFYPRIFCPHCHSDGLTWVKASGNGKIYSYTVVRSNPPSAFVKDLPYIVAIIRLDEGVTMLSNVVGCSPEEVEFEMPVQVVFEKLNEEFTLPKFKPIQS